MGRFFRNSRFLGRYGDAVVHLSVQHLQPVKAVRCNDYQGSGPGTAVPALQQILHVAGDDVVDFVAVVTVHPVVHVRLVAAGVGVDHPVRFQAGFLVHFHILPLMIDSVSIVPRFGRFAIFRLLPTMEFAMFLAYNDLRKRDTDESPFI